MGTKYSTVVVSGYNASPPPDNNSTGADNQITWAKHTSKIGNPLKTAIEAIDTKLVAYSDQSTRLVLAADNTVAGDHNRTVQISSSITSTITVSLGDAATMAAGYTVTVANMAPVACLVGRVTGGDTVNGVATNVSIASLEAITFVVNAAANGYLIKARNGAGLNGAKAWVSWASDGSIAAGSSYNVSSVTDNDVGTFTVNFIVPFANVGYTALPVAQDTNPPRTMGFGTKLVGSCVIISRDSDGNGADSAGGYSAVFFGVQ